MWYDVAIAGRGRREGDGNWCMYSVSGGSVLVKMAKFCFNALDKGLILMCHYERHLLECETFS